MRKLWFDLSDMPEENIRADPEMKALYKNLKTIFEGQAEKKPDQRQHTTGGVSND